MRLCVRLLQQSSYSVGLAYELLVMEVLERYSFQLKHTGGAGDGGQDFNGYWVLPEKRVPVVGQCKCYRKPVGPGDVREFENVLLRKFQHRHGSHQSISGYLGIMASQNWFSASALRTFHSSRTPLIFCQILKSQAPADDNITEEEPLSTVAQVIRGAGGGGEREGGEGGRGHINELALNEKACSLLGNVQVTWRLNREHGNGQTLQRNVFLLNS